MFFLRRKSINCPSRSRPGWPKRGAEWPASGPPVVITTAVISVATRRLDLRRTRRRPLPPSHSASRRRHPRYRRGRRRLGSNYHRDASPLSALLSACRLVLMTSSPAATSPSRIEKEHKKRWSTEERRRRPRRVLEDKNSPASIAIFISTSSPTCRCQIATSLDFNEWPEAGTVIHRRSWSPVY